MSFVRKTIYCLLVTTGVVATGIQAQAQETNDVISVAIPQSGPYRLFGSQFVQGLSASPLAADIEFNLIDTACSRAGGQAAAPQLTSDLIIGFVCVDALDAAQQTGALSGKTLVVPFSGPLSQAPATDTSRFARTVSFGPSPDDETAILADFVTTNWRNENIAIIDDGTLYGRKIAEDVRAQMSEQNLTPVYTTTFRPQLDNQVGLVRLLQRSGATHVVVGGDRFDAAAIAAGAEIVGYDLTLAGGTAFGEGVAEGTLPAGTAYVSLPNWADKEATQDFIAALDETGIIAEGFAFWGYATGQLVSQWRMQQAVSQGTIADTSWQTIMGELQFDSSGALATNLYTIIRVVAEGDDGTN